MLHGNLLYMFEKARDQIERILVFPAQVVLFFSVVALVEMGNRAFKMWKYSHHE